MTLPAPSPATAAHPWCDALDREFPARQVDLGDGVRVTVREAGPHDAPPVVLLHGIGSGSASWLPVVRLLAAHCRVLAWDAPGYGDSTPLAAAEPTTADYAHRLDRLLAVLDWPRTVLVGHSLGGLMAGAFAALHPQRLQRVVLLCPAGGYGAPGLQARAQQVRDERLGTLDRLGVAGMARERGPRLVRDGAGEDIRQWAVWNMARLRPDGYRQAVAMLCSGHLAANAPLTMPVEVHVGEHDRVTTPDAVRAIAAAFGVDCGLIADAGHLVSMDQPAAVAALIELAVQASNGR
jgi:pimeloyl-ACP methyl ester carboxylesterase